MHVKMYLIMMNNDDDDDDELQSLSNIWPLDLSK